MPPVRRYDIPVHSLDALVLQAARADYSTAIYRRVYRPSLVFHWDLRYDPYHREYGSSRNLLNTIDPIDEAKLDPYYFSLVLPRPQSPIPTTEFDENDTEVKPDANTRVRRLSSMVIYIALALRRKLRSS